ncbi:MAG TPA: DNA primase [Terriglobales bacterium]|nr:DNA primase [Terriglobales bacterium]
MPNPGSLADTVKQQADIVRVVGEYVKLKKSGAQNYTGLCPFHKEKTPSFSVHATRQFYHCFGCGASGDVFSFVQKVENITFPEAVRAVAQKAGVPLPKASFSGPGEARDAKLRATLLDLHDRACAFFQDQLRRPEGTAAREYLAGRGLTEETIRAFRIGFAPDSGFLLRDYFKGVSDEEALRASGLFAWKSEGASPVMYSRFRNRVMFPIANEAGKIVAFTGRTLATDERSGPKYLNSPETPIYSKSRVLFNLDRAREAIRKLDYAILVEGQMDCIAVDAAGFHNVIASSGTAFTEAQVRLLARFTRNLVVNFDPDTAGAAAAERSLALLVAEDFHVKVLTLEPGLDPDLFLRRRGREAYARALRESQKYFDYLIERARASFPVRTPEGKVQAVTFLLPHIHRVPSRIARDELAQEIAQKLGIDSAVLREELRHAAATRTATVRPAAEPQVTDAERILIRALASGGQLPVEPGGNPVSEPAEQLDPARQARFALSTEGLHEGLASESLLELLLQKEEDADALALPLSDSDRSLLAAILMDEREELTPELLEGAIEALRRRHLERRRRQLKAEIAEAERRSDSATLSRLLQEKVDIDRVLATH